MWAVALALAAALVALTVCTELYRCKERFVTDEDRHGQTSLEWSSTSIHFDHSAAHFANCCQCLGIWGVHCTTLLVFLLAVVAFVLAGLMTPMAVAVSDACVVADNFVNNVPLWMNESGLLESELSINAVTSCMEQTSITKALQIDKKLSLINTLNFSSVVDMDAISGVNFAQLQPMVTAVNAMTVGDFGYVSRRSCSRVARALVLVYCYLHPPRASLLTLTLLAVFPSFRSYDVNDANQLVAGINTLVSTAQCYNPAAAPNPATTYTIADCTPSAYPIPAGDAAHGTCVPQSAYPTMHDVAPPGSDGCVTQLAALRSGILQLLGSKVRFMYRYILCESC